MKLKFDQRMKVLFNVVICVIFYVVSISGFSMLDVVEYDLSNIIVCVLFIIFATLELANVPLMVCYYSYKNKRRRKRH